MINYFAELLSDYFVENEVVLPEDKSIYKYGTEVVISSILGIVIVIALSAVLGQFQDGMLFLLCFIPIRIYAGGYHANTYLKCNATFITVFIFTSLVSRNLPEVFQVQLSILFLIASLVVIILLSPIENKRKPISDYEKKRYRRISIIMSVLWIVTSIVLFIFDINIIPIVSLTMFTIAILMIVEKIIQIIQMKNLEGQQQ